MKNRIFIRTLAALLSMLMIVSVLPFNIWAENWASGDGKSGESGSSQSVALDGLQGNVISNQFSYGITEQEYVSWESNGEYNVTGSGTENDPYCISTPEAFVAFATNVNNGEYYKNGRAYIFVKLSANIDFGGEEWIPIGTESQPFVGSFDGGFHEVIKYNISYPKDENNATIIDAEEKYASFFGYVKDSEIKNFGVYNYKVDYNYNFDSTVGGFVGYSENTTITDCFANGSIAASYEKINPYVPINDRDQVKYLNAFETVPKGNDIGLIYNVEECNEGVGTIAIPANVTAVKFIGDTNEVYENLSIQILHNEDFDIYLEFVNFNFVGTEGTPAIFCDEGCSRYITICSSGDHGSSITGSMSNPAISAPNSVVYINAQAPLTIRGGVGADGANGADGDEGVDGEKQGESGKDGSRGKDGVTGEYGATGIIADSLYINVDATSNKASSVYIYGGQGGRGGQGGQGGRGGTGAGGNGGSKEVKNIINAGAGGRGGDGGCGGDGGQGGLPYTIGVKFSVNQSAAAYVHLYYGLQGAGGAGGRGGSGGDGGVAHTKGLSASWGNKGGYASGGRGGDGGDGGRGGAGSIYGSGGAGGDSGGGGVAGKQLWTNLTGTIEYGRFNYDGKLKGPAAPGKSGTAATTDDTNNDLTNKVCGYKNELFSVPFMYLYHAHLTVGGFIGEMGPGSKLSFCAAVVNNIKFFNIDDKTNDSSRSIRGNFVGSYSQASADNIIAALFENNKLQKYDINGWFGSAPDYNWQISNINILNLTEKEDEEKEIKYLADDLGLVYGDEINVTDENGTTRECSVVGIAAEIKTDITIPDYVFSSRWITAVTAIRGKSQNNSYGAFQAGNPCGGSIAAAVICGKNIKTIGDHAFYGSSITSIDTNNTKKVGAYAFANCQNLTRIVLGDSVNSVGKYICQGSNDLQSMYIGASLSFSGCIKNNEIYNAEPVFGIDKVNNSVFKTYEVSKENPDMIAIDGVLCEKITVKDNDDIETQLAVAVIDAPVASEVTNFNKINVSDQNASGADYRFNYIVKIYPNAFAYHRKLQRVELGYVRDIGTSAFLNCELLSEVKFLPEPELKDKGLEKGTIETPRGNVPYDAVKYSQRIGVNAFKGCKALTSIDLSNDYINAIGVGAFQACGGNSSISINLGQNIRDLGIEADDEVSSEKEISICNVQLVFENTRIKSYSVVSGNKCYCAVDGVLYHYVPSGTNNSTPYMELIAYPSHKEEENYTTLENIEFNGKTLAVTTIGALAFTDTEHLKNLVISNSIIQIKSSAFTGSSINTLKIGAGVASIETSLNATGGAFNGCDNLASIIVDEDNQYYSSDKNVLYNKDKTCLLKYPQNKEGRTLYVLDTVSSISNYAFSGNNLLSNIVFSAPIETMGLHTFENCNSLSTVVFESGKNPFSGNGLTVFENYFKVDKNNQHSRLTVLYGKLNSDGKHEYDTSWLQNNLGMTTVNGEVQYSNTHYTDTQNPTAVITFARNDGFVENEPTDTGYYAFMVYNKSGERINQIRVTLKEKYGDWSETVITQNGICVFYNLDYSKTYELSFADVLAVYYPLEYEEICLDEDIRATYVTLSKIPTVSGVSAKYSIVSDEITVDIGKLVDNEINGIVTGKVVDINSQTAKINRRITPEVEIKAVFGKDADTKILSYSLIQMSKGRLISVYSVPEFEHDMNSANIYISMTIPTSHFIDEADVYLVAEVLEDKGDRYQIQSKLNLHVFSFGPKMLDIPNFGDNLKIGLDDDLAKFLGMDGISLFNNKMDVKVIASVEEDSYKFAFEIGKDVLSDFGLDETEDSGWDEAWTAWIDAINKRKDDGKKPFGATENVSKISLGFTFGGFIEQKYNASVTTAEKVTTSYGIKGSLKFTFEAGTTITVVVVPVRVDLEVSLEGEVQFVLSFDGDKRPEFDVDMGVTVTLDLSLGLGLKVASVGVYGNVKMYVLVGVLPDVRPKEFSVEADLGFYLKVDALLLKIDYRHSLLKTKSTIYYDENGNVSTVVQGGVQKSLSVAKAVSAMYDQSNYVMVRSDSAQSEYEFKGLNSADAYEKFNPKMIKVGKWIYAVYYADLNGYSDNYDSNNYQKIVYQIYNTETGEWSEFKILDDNGLSDGEFELYTNGNEIFIAYSQLKDKLGGAIDNIEVDENGRSESIDENESIKSYLKMHEIKMAKCTVSCDVAGEFADASVLTQDDFYDASIATGIIDSKPTIVWVKNENASMFLEGVNVNTIYYSQYIDNKWTQAEVLMSGIGTITNIAIDNVGNIVYITDNDNVLAPIIEVPNEKGSMDEVLDEDNIYDKIINIFDLNGNVYSSDLGAYSDLSHLDGKLTCYLKETLYAIETENGIVTLKPIFGESNKGIADSYEVVKDAGGNDIAILYVNSTVSNNTAQRDGSEDPETNSSNIFAIFRYEDAWGEPIRLTDFGAGVYVDSFEAVNIGGQLMLSVLVSEEIYTEETGEYITTKYESKTEMIDLPTGYSMSEVTFDYYALHTEGSIPQTATVTLKVTNDGYQALNIDDFEVKIARGNVDCTGISRSGFYKAAGEEGMKYLAPGETAFVDVTFNHGGVTEDSYTVTVGETEEEIKLWYSDFEIHGKQIVISQKVGTVGNKESYVDTYYIVLNVENIGNLPGKYTVRVLNENAPDADPIESKDIELAPGQSKRIEVKIGDSTDSYVIIARVDAEGEYATANNECKINVSTQTAKASEDKIDSIVSVSPSSDKIYRGSTSDLFITLKSEYDLEKIEIVETNEEFTWYTVDESRVIINSSVCDYLENGKYTLKFVFAEGVSYYDLIISEHIDVRWYYGYPNEAQWEFVSDAFEWGKVPVMTDVPTLDSDGMYTYTFVGWDVDGDGIAEDEFLPVTSHTEYTEYYAIFDRTAIYYTVNWIVDDAVMATEQYMYGQIPNYPGDAPVKASDDQNEYNFTGWSHITEVTGDMNIYAMFEEVHNPYTITFKIGDRVYEYTQTYGSDILLPPDMTSSWYDDKYIYTFTGWSPELTTVRGNQTYVATYDTSIREFDICWSVDGEITHESYEYGVLPIFNGSTDKAGDARYSYEFIGWDKEITPATDHITYTAVYKEVLNKYTITWIVDCKEYTEEYEYGRIPEFKNSTFKDSDGENIYIFAGWDVEPYAVDGDRTYVAVYTAEAIVFVDITIKNVGADKSGAVITPLNGKWTEGENAFTVSCQNVCLVMISSDGGNTYTILEAYETDTDNCYGFIAEDVSADTIITVVVAGDATGDGQINGHDVLLLRKYMANLDYDTGVSSVEVYHGADVNGDGTVNGRDVLLLRKYMEEYDYDTGFSTVVLGPQ